MDTEIDLKVLVESVGDAFVGVGPDNNITMWNPGATRIFGYSAQEALGHSLDLIVPERLRQRHWDACQVTMATGVTKYGHDLLRVPAVDKQGRAMSIAFTVAMLFSPDGKVAHVVSIIRDETSRFNEDRAMRRRLAELEAQLAGQPQPSATEAVDAAPVCARPRP